MMRAAKQPPSGQSVREVAQDVQSAVWREITTRLLLGLRAVLEGLLEDEVTGTGRGEPVRADPRPPGPSERPPPPRPRDDPRPPLEAARPAAPGGRGGLHPFDKYQRRQAVKAGGGIAIISRLAVASDIKHRELAVVPIAGLKLSREFYLITHRHRSRSPICNAFLTFLGAPTLPHDPHHHP